MSKIVHPAKYSDALLPVLARYVDGARTILDPFAGTGRVGLLRQHLTVPPDLVCANELEPEWLAEARGNGCDERICGDARRLPYRDGRFDAVCTSPAYGNRMADACDWAPGRRHSTYTSALRETVGDPTASLQPGNAGALQWGDAYRSLHREAWAEAWRVLVPGGRLVLNVADHYRDGQLQGVPEWHVSALLGIGFDLVDYLAVETPRYGFGANSDKRAPELVILFAKPGKDGPKWARYPEKVPSGLPTADCARSGAMKRLDLWAVEPEPQQLGLFAGGGA